MIKLGEFVLGLIFYVFGWYVDIRFINLMLVPRKKAAVNPMIIGPAVVINWFSYYFIPEAIILTITSNLAYFVIVALVYEGSWIKKIFTAAMIQTIGVTVEDFVWYFLSLHSSGGYEDQLGTLYSFLLRLLIVIILERYIKVGKEIQLPIGSYLNLIIISVGGGVLSWIIVEMNAAKGVVIVGMLLISIMNLSTYYLYEKVYESYNNRIDSSIMDQQIAAFQNQLAVIQESDRNMRLLRHDYKNHMFLLNSYIQNENYEKVKEYIGQMIQCIEGAGQYVQTGNDVIDSILNYMFDRAERMQCELDIKIELPAERLISDFDMNTLLSNLLTNALEALERADEKRLSTYIRYEKNILYISVYNTFDGLVYKKEKSYLTTKKQRDEHGVGMKNIKSIIEKYHGEIRIRDENKIFKTDIILFIETT